MSLITPDFGLLFWMTIIFAAVFFILSKFGFPVITGMVDKRNERIANSIRLAKEAEKKTSEMADLQAKMIEETRSEQARILKEAAQARDAMLEQAREDARAETESMIGKARDQIAAEKENALRDIRREVAVLSVEMAEKVLRKELESKDAQIELIDRMIGETAGLN